MTGRTTPENITKLYSHNLDVDRVNDEKLSKIEPEEIEKLKEIPVVEEIKKSTRKNSLFKFDFKLTPVCANTKSILAININTRFRYR